MGRTALVWVSDQAQAAAGGPANPASVREVQPTLDIGGELVQDVNARIHQNRIRSGDKDDNAPATSSGTMRRPRNRQETR